MIARPQDILKGSSVSDFHPDYQCDQCNQDATVHHLGKRYCNKHWSIELGFKKEK